MGTGTTPSPDSQGSNQEPDPDRVNGVLRVNVAAQAMSKYAQGDVRGLCRVLISLTDNEAPRGPLEAILCDGKSVLDVSKANHKWYEHVRDHHGAQHVGRGTGAIALLMMSSAFCILNVTICVRLEVFL